MFDFLSVFGYIFQILYYLGLIYYLLIVIFFIMTWISPLYGTKIFNFFEKISSPFMKIVSNKLILGGFDLGATLGLILYYLLLELIRYLAIVL